MFSSINEAWGQDPVKDMTRRLKSGEFTRPPEQAQIYKMNKNLSNSKNQDLSTDGDILSLSDQSLRLGSDSDSEDIYGSISFGGFKNSGKNLSRKPQRKIQGRKKHQVKFLQSDTSSPDDFSDSDDYSEPNECAYSIKHLNKCGHCYRKLIKIIDKKVKQKCDSALLDAKLRQIQNQSVQNPSSSPVQSSISNNDSLKETLIIVIGAVIAIFIIFLITKSFGSK
jgi:hypothetical protein